MHETSLCLLRHPAFHQCRHDLILIAAQLTALQQCAAVIEIAVLVPLVEIGGQGHIQLEGGQLGRQHGEAVLAGDNPQCPAVVPFHVDSANVIHEVYFALGAGKNGMMGIVHSVQPRVITKEQRTVDFLKQIVTRIYAAMRRTEYMVCEMYPQIKPFLPHDIHFIHSEELCQMYPDKTPKEREHAIAQKYGAVFMIGIGCKLSDGKEHDLRAPDYDDYTTINPETGLPGLNGDLLVWDKILDRSVELSSMGIRVDKEALLRQLTLSGQEKRKELYFHKRLLDETLPLCIGGGIGQSRLCMLYLQKAHIGEIQASIWPEDMRKECAQLGMQLI